MYSTVWSDCFLFCVLLWKFSEFWWQTEVIRIVSLAILAILVYTPRAGNTHWPMLSYRKAEDIGIFPEFVSVWEIKFFDVLPNGGKMSNSLLLYLKNRWKHGRSLRPLQQNLVWVENEDFCFKLPAAYVRLTLLLCF